MAGPGMPSYLGLVTGLTRATRQRANAAARGLLATAGLEGVANDAGERVNRLTEEILTASRANRQLLENLVAGEVTKAASRLGFVRSDDLDEVREEIAELRVQLQQQARASAHPAPAPPPDAAPTSPLPGAAPLPDPAADAGA
jgi:polyhydroxyalkanoate synthesis regulator phasin